VLVTARDNAQTLELARERWPNVVQIGVPSPGGRAAKALSIGERIRDLRRWARSARPDVALSHNSYAQIAAAKSLRLPAVTAMDYEHQPANHLAFRLADRILLPEVLPLDSVRSKGATPAKVRRYPGLKEEIYLGDFEPDPTILDKVGITREAGTVVVVLRAPPVGALYHQFANPAYERVLEQIAEAPHARCVALARHPDQRAALAGRRNCIVPEHAIDSRSLLYESDLFVGAGGTMTREAALLGIPTVSVYAGEPPLIERSLEQQGLLTRLDSRGLHELRPRASDPVSPATLRERGERLISFFVENTLEIASPKT
jgi:predicted glycosyltransferase